MRATSRDPAQPAGQGLVRMDGPGPGRPAASSDSFLVRALPGVSRRAVGALIKAGHVCLNRGLGKKGSRVRSGDRIRAQVQLSLRPSPSLPVRLVYAQGAVLGLDKPPGLPQRCPAPERYPHGRQLPGSPLPGNHAEQPVVTRAARSRCGSPARHPHIGIAVGSPHGCGLHGSARPVLGPPYCQRLSGLGARAAERPGTRRQQTLFS